MVGMSVAIPAASLCINRRLYLIATRSYTSTKAEKQRAVLVDLAIGLGIPVLEMILRMFMSIYYIHIFKGVVVQNIQFKAIVLTSSRTLAAIR